jgi:hypothetical protein
MESIMIILIISIPFLLIAFSLGLKNKLQIENSKIEIKGENIDNLINKKIELTNNLVKNKLAILNQNPIILTSITSLLNNNSKHKSNPNISSDNNLAIILEEIKTTIDNKDKDYIDYLKELEKLNNSLIYSSTLYNETILKYNKLIKKFPYNIVAKIFNYYPYNIINLNY